MKIIVVDISVIIKFFFPEVRANKAQKLKEDHLQRKINLYSRDLLLYEFTSSLRNYKAVEINAKDFILAVKILESIKLQIVPLDYKDLPDIFNISNRLNISIYDSSYLLLAQKLRAPLYTADKKLHQSCKNIVSSFFV